MSFLAGIAQVLLFLILLKLSHIVYWNVKKTYYIHPWLSETVIAILLVVLFHYFSSVWALVIMTSVALGVIRGDQEETKSSSTRQLL